MGINKACEELEKELEFKLPILPDEGDPDERVSKSLSGFYKNLGWNPDKRRLDVTKVVISTENYDKIVNLFKSVKGVDTEWLMAICVQFMPRAEEIPNDKTLMRLGAIKEDVQCQLLHTP